jgi:hypothetical protein
MFSKLEGDGALRRDGTTTKDGVFLEHLEYDGPLFADKFGRLCVVGGEGRLSLIVNVGETLQITESHDVE